MNKKELDQELIDFMINTPDRNWVNLAVLDYTVDSLLKTKEWIEQEVQIKRWYTLNDKYLIIVIHATELLDLLHLGMNMSFEFPGDEFPITVESVVTISHYE